MVEEAVLRGEDVIVIDDLSTGRMENIEKFIDSIEFVKGDIRDLEIVMKCMKGVDYVFHHAAIASVPVTIEDPIRSAEVNDLGTLNVFHAAQKSGIKKVVYASSSAIYGNSDLIPSIETSTPAPETPYAAHKLMGEYYASIFKSLYGLDIVSLRYFNVFGPRQDPSSPYSGVISIFFHRLKNGLNPIVYGDGGQSRDFIYVKDAVRANFKAIKAVGIEEPIYNIGAGNSVSLNQLLLILEELIGTKVTAEYAPPRSGDIYESRADVSRAKNELNFTAATQFEEGLAETWKWFKSGGLRY